MSEDSENQVQTASPRPSVNDSQNRLELAVLHQISEQLVREQRSTRHWNIFFRFVFVSLFIVFLLLGYIIASILFLFADSDDASSPLKNTPHTAVIDIKGEISDGESASAKNIIKALRAAVTDANTKGIVLRASSNGGSPVQAAYVYDEIIKLKQLYPAIKIYTVIVEGCFSACYYIASATDEIYANRHSLIGSIGVIYEGYGYSKLMQKLGIERRIIKAGKDKDYLDSYSPLNIKHQKHHQELLKQVLSGFIRDVKKGRKNRLKKETPALFSGLIWNANTSKDLGLIDGLGDVYKVAKLIGAEQLVDFTVTENILQQIIGKLGVSLSKHLLQQSNGKLKFR